MKSEREKMIAGEMYDPLDAALSAARTQTRLLIKALNESREDEPLERRQLVKQLIPNAGTDLWLQPPFFCDYGFNIFIGEKVFFNFNCVVLDIAPVTIGSRTMFGPNVQLYTAMHPMNHRERSAGLEYGKPIVIGNDVWVGGSAVICPGTVIGDRAVIGAGSVVTRNIPADVFAAGNPCRVIRPIN